MIDDVALTEKARKLLDRLGTLLAGSASPETLMRYKEAGEVLIELKDEVPHGKFGPLVQERFHLKKSQRADLMNLARYWSDFEAAKAYCEDKGEPLTSTSYRIEVALDLIDWWKNRQNGVSAQVPRPRRTRRPASTDEGLQADLENTQREKKALEQKLEEVQWQLSSTESERAKANQLENEISSLRERLKQREEEISNLRATVRYYEAEAKIRLLLASARSKAPPLPMPEGSGSPEFSRQQLEKSIGVPLPELRLDDEVQPVLQPLWHHRVRTGGASLPFRNQGKPSHHFTI